MKHNLLPITSFFSLINAELNVRHTTCAACVSAEKDVAQADWSIAVIG